MNQFKATKFENKLVRYLLFAALVPACLLLYTMWAFQVSVYLIALTVLFLFCVIGLSAYSIHTKTSFQLQSLSNLLSGLSEGDYSMRGIHHHSDDALGELVLQINKLADALSQHRYIAHESQLLVSKIIQHIDVAIIAIDAQQKIALLNPAAEQLLSTKQDEAIGKGLEVYHAQVLLSLENNQVTPLDFATTQTHYQVVKDHYREQGQQHQLFFITNVHGLLREHERQAWQNLIRVLSHEINNSLAPIASLANTLKAQAEKQKLDDIFSDNLAIISGRAKSLRSFIDSYRQLSFLPPPQKQATDLNELLNKIPPLFTQREFYITNNFTGSVWVDPVQLEHVLINIVKNAYEAMLDLDNLEQGIQIKVTPQSQHLTIEVIDSGVGLQNTENLFTPFYSTKKEGSGIGLLLSRQIIEAHGGYISIDNRQDASGCKVTIVLPLDSK